MVYHVCGVALDKMGCGGGGVPIVGFGGACDRELVLLCLDGESRYHGNSYPCPESL